MCVCYVQYIRIADGVISLSVFFFQAEDGIRDLVRSRGLGDVYKRQVQRHLPVGFHWRKLLVQAGEEVGLLTLAGRQTTVDLVQAVSYTHLTLPTSDLV